MIIAMPSDVAKRNTCIFTIIYSGDGFELVIVQDWAQKANTRAPWVEKL